MIPYQHAELKEIDVPDRQSDAGYVRPHRDTNNYVPDTAAKLLAASAKTAGDKKKVRA